MSMNKDSCDVTYHDVAPERPQPGDLWTDHDLNEDGKVEFIYLVFPDGSESGGLQVGGKKTDGYPFWQMTGDPREPKTLSLSPSLHLLRCWHGYLRNGRLESC